MIAKLDAYRIFCEVAKHRSFSKTAKSLYMTQPAVSQVIMNLERELDTRLFTRTSKGVNLTNDGRLLYEYVNSAINLINVGEKKLAESRDLLTGEMKIGVGDTISRYYLLPYLEIFHNSSPNINLKIINRTTMELCAMLKSGEIDLAVCNLPVKDSALCIKKCIDIHDIFVCGEKYRHLCSSPVEIEDIAKLPLIFLERKSNSRQYVERYLASKGIKIQPEIELVLIAGESHKTGQGKDLNNHYRALAEFAGDIFTIDDIPYRWSAQDCMTLDGIPYIGNYAPDTPDLYIATGFQKWGMTSSMVSAMIIRDLISKGENPWQNVFDPSRKNIAGSVKNFIVENLDVAKHFISGKIKPVSENYYIKPGEADIIESNAARKFVDITQGRS
jgi:DNA-binding transcriptional LysR family regulator